MSPYEQLQHALVEARRRHDEAWPAQKRQYYECVEFARNLLIDVRSHLGLPEKDAEERVVFRIPYTRNPAPDDSGFALQIRPDHYEIQLDVMVKPPSGRDHGLYVIVRIFKLDGTHYRLAFDGEHSVSLVVDVDAADTTTFVRFSRRLVDVMLEYYKRDGTDSGSVRASTRIGFAAP